MTRMYERRKEAAEDHERDRNLVHSVIQCSFSHAKEFGAHCNCKKSPWRDFNTEMSLRDWHYLSRDLIRKGREIKESC